MAISLKISNAAENSEELSLRVQKLAPKNQKFVRRLLDSIANNDWKQVYSDLLFRIELYSSLKILNYTRQDLNVIVEKTHSLGIDPIVNALVSKIEATKIANATVEAKIETPENFLVFAKQFWTENFQSTEPKEFTQFANIFISLIDNLQSDEKFLHQPLNSGVDFADIEDYILGKVTGYRLPASIQPKTLVQAVIEAFGLNLTEEYEQYEEIYEPTSSLNESVSPIKKLLEKAGLLKFVEKYKSKAERITGHDDFENSSSVEDSLQIIEDALGNSAKEEAEKIIDDSYEKADLLLEGFIVVQKDFEIHKD